MSVEDSLPANFAEKMLELESLLDQQHSLSVITDLNELYRMGIDYYIRYQPRRAKLLQNKMIKLLADPNTLQLIQNGGRKEKARCKLPTKIREEVGKFETCSDSYIKNIIENSEKVLKKQEDLKNMDLNKQQQMLNQRIMLKKCRSQQKIQLKP